MRGVILFSDGSGYVGELTADGKRQGHGTFVHDASDIQYDGEWFDDLWDGDGYLYSVRDMTVLHGIWHRGELSDLGLRKDLWTGCTWTEGYNRQGNLITHGLISIENEHGSSDQSSDNQEGGAPCPPSRRLRSPPDSSPLSEVTRESSKRRLQELTAATESGSYNFLRYVRVSQNQASHTNCVDCPCRLTALEFADWLREERICSKTLADLLREHKLRLVDVLAAPRSGFGPARWPLGARVELDELRRVLENRLMRNLLKSVADWDFVIPFEELSFDYRMGGPLSSTYRGTWLEQPVAIKVFSGCLHDPEAWSRYVHLLATVNHPTLVQALGVAVRLPCIWCVVSEFIDGSSVDQALCTKTNYSYDALLIGGGWQRSAGSSMPLTFANVQSWNEDATVLAPGGAGLARSTECPHRALHLTQLLKAYGGFAKPAQGPQGLSRSRQTQHGGLSAGGLGLPLRNSAPRRGQSLGLSSSPVPLFLQPILRTLQKRRPAARPARRSLSLDAADIVSILLSIVQCAQYLEGLEEFTDQRLCHGAIKPSNIFMTEQGDVRIGDYAQYLLERAFQPVILELNDPTVCDACHEMTQLLDIIPTNQRKEVNWLAPEFLRLPITSKCNTEKGDVYAFGITAASLLLRTKPYDKLSSTQVRILRGYSNVVSPPIEKIWPPLKPLVTQCMQQDAAARPTWAEVAQITQAHRRTATAIAENALLALMGANC